MSLTSTTTAVDSGNNIKHILAGQNYNNIDINATTPNIKSQTINVMSNDNIKTSQFQEHTKDFQSKDHNSVEFDHELLDGGEFEVPDFTIKDILSAIPAECYNRSTFRSLGYVARDISALILFGYLAIYHLPKIPYLGLRIILWTTYVFIQGLFATGLWVLAHECGHNAFSDYPLLNDIVGWFLHSSLLVPYFSWKYSHAKHHKHNGCMTKDMVFVPKTRQEFLRRKHAIKINDVTEEAPLATLIHLFAQQFFGWHIYLATDVTSGAKYPGVSKWKINHFHPSAPLFNRRQYWDIVVSDLGVLVQGFLVYLGFQKFGAQNMMLHYILPWTTVNNWLIFVTYLQHTDVSVPRYETSKWTFALGANCTIDRDFGFIGKHIFHDIIETHVLHHFVSRIPFYRGRVGTEAIKKVMGKHYRYNPENMFQSLYKTARSCQFVEGTDGVMLFRNANGIGSVPPKPDQDQD